MYVHMLEYGRFAMARRYANKKEGKREFCVN